MTTEEKAKAYDEALERARKELKQDLHESGIWAIQRIFPELRESEDERIRKELKEAFEAYDIESKWNGIPIRSIFAWLEKQKEPMPSWSEEDETSIAVKNPEAYKIGFADGEAYAREQKEHWKPSEEQMIAFRNYIDSNRAKAEASVGGWNNYDAMITLFEDLKNL